ncbi:MAG: metalloregulator ArsR/SmtB family transcription factor [Chloroflexi bacterium]|nr:metalloregulator ArsR/SmtB family transcription factor [Chloroflexota bacterium]
MNHEKNLAQRAALFKALGHPARLLMLNLMREHSRHGEELAAILSLNPATVSHHLAKLAEAGLVTPRKEQYYQVYSLRGDLLKKTLMEMVQMPQETLSTGVEQDAFRAKVLHTFFKHGRLTQIPSQRKKVQIILETIAAEFEPGRKYEEREVNHILLDFNEDFASLRRYLIEFNLLARDKGIYWCVEK